MFNHRLKGQKSIRRRRRSFLSSGRPRRPRLEWLERRHLLAGNVTGILFGDVDADGNPDTQPLGAETLLVYLDTNFNGQRDTGEPFDEVVAGGSTEIPYEIDASTLAEGTEVVVRVDIPRQRVVTPALSVDLALNDNQSRVTDLDRETFNHQVVAGDFDGDDITDIGNYQSSNSRFAFFRGQQDGSFPFEESESVHIGLVSKLIAGDFDGDGRDDIVSISTATGSVVVRGGFDGQSFTLSDPNTLLRPRDVVAGNFDSDSDTEFVVLSQDASQNMQVTVFQPGSGFEFSGQTTTYTGITLPGGFAAADFNHDGALDLAVFRPGTGEIIFLPGSDSGAFGNPITSTIAGANFATGIVAITSISDDEVFHDLAVINGNGVALLEGDGSGSFELIDELETLDGEDDNGQVVKGTPSRIVAFDMDGDGDSDLALTSNTLQFNFIGASIQVFENRGLVDGFIQRRGISQINVAYGADRPIPVSGGNFLTPRNAGGGTRIARRLLIGAPSQDFDSSFPEFSQLGLKYSNELFGQEYRLTLSSAVSDGQDFGLLPAPNSPPSISNLGNQTIQSSQTIGPIPFNINDEQSPPNELTVTAVSSNPTLVPNDSISIEGTGNSRTLTATAAASQAGFATITVTVSDPEGLTATDSFGVVVLAPPSIAPVDDQSAFDGTTSDPIPLTVTDIDGNPGSVAVSATSSDQSVVPNGNIVVAGVGSNRTVTITPLAGQTGQVTITLRATDADFLSASISFLLTVEPSDTTPPRVTSFTRSTPSTARTSADTLIFRATFSEAVVGVTLSDFEIESASTATLTGLTAIAGDTFELTVAGGNLAEFEGQVGLNLSASASFSDTSGNQVAIVEPATDEVFVLDNTSPVIASIVRAQPLDNPTSADELTFVITFNEDVEAVDAADFGVTGSTASIVALTQSSAAEYTVTVAGGDLPDLNGTVSLNVAFGNDIVDTAGIPLGNTPAIGPNQSYQVAHNPGGRIIVPGAVVRPHPTAGPAGSTAIYFRAEVVTEISIAEVGTSGLVAPSIELLDQDLTVVANTSQRGIFLSPLAAGQSYALVIQGGGNEDLYVIRSSAGPGSLSGNVATNLLHRTDVNADGSSTALDALLIINELARRSLIMNPDAEFIFKQYYDANADGRVSAGDALNVINRLGQVGTAATVAVAVPAAIQTPGSEAPEPVLFDAPVTREVKVSSFDRQVSQQPAEIVSVLEYFPQVENTDDIDALLSDLSFVEQLVP